MYPMKKVFVDRPIIKPALDILKRSGHEVVVWDNNNSDPTEEEWMKSVRYIMYSMRITENY